MKRFTLLAIAVLLLQLVFPFSSTVNAEGTASTIHYTAIGDSLAAGMNEKGGIGLGYADYLAQAFTDDGTTVQFNKGFAYPGYTTTDVLADIKANVSKPVVSLNGVQQQTEKIADSLKNADIISISAGANDVLKHIVRSETGNTTFDIPGVMEEVQAVVANYQAIFDEIYTLNEDAEVIVMGYYNPFPYLVAYESQLNLLVQSLDGAVGKVVEANGGTYVNIADKIATNYLTYLPNPQNIHLSAVGYKAVADSMYEAYVLKLLAELEETESTIKPVYFSDTVGHGSESYINLAVHYGIMKGYEDGTFRPNNNMTRVQLISVISRTFDLTATDLAPFIDIQSYALDTRYEISAAYEAGIIQGYGDYLKPKDYVTRAQLALMIARGYKQMTGETFVPTTIAPFTDISNYNLETKHAISLLYDFDLAQGVGNGKFAPANRVTRAQAAKILSGLFIEIE